MHYLHEVKSTDELQVETSILDADRKRIHAGCRFTCARMSESRRRAKSCCCTFTKGTSRRAPSFPPEIEHRLEALKLSSDGSAARGPSSRKIELKRR